MFNIQLANLNIGIDNRYTYIEEQCADYIAGGGADFTVSVTDAQISAEAKMFPDMSLEKYAGYLESLAAYRQIAERLLDYDGFLLHSAIIRVNERGVAFAARSGTGKTTHIRLWRKLLGDGCSVINGDKPLIRFIDGAPYAFGTPWAGKEGYNTNSRARLYDMCFLSRAAENYAVAMDSKEAVKRLLCQIYMPDTPAKKLKTFSMADRLLKNIRVWDIGCNMDISAAKTVYDKLFEGSEEL